MASLAFWIAAVLALAWGGFWALVGIVNFFSNAHDLVTEELEKAEGLLRSILGRIGRRG